MKGNKNNTEKIKRRWSENEINIIIENYEKTPKDEIIELLPNRSWNSIKLKANNLSLNRSNDFQRESNMKILLKDVVKSFYWIGFLIADGYINKSMRLKLTLSIKDLDHLIKFSKYVECNNIQKDDKKCTITLQNKEICPEICKKFKINERKTYNQIDFNDYKFDRELLFSLIIGFIDGDGCIKKVHNRKDCNIKIHLHKSWLNNLIFIENFIYGYFGKDNNKQLSKIGNDGYSIITISNNEIINMIKKECLRLRLPIMSRKWNLIDEDKISRNITNREVKINIINLYKSGLSPRDIISRLGLKEGVVYKHIRNYKKGLEISQLY